MRLRINFVVLGASIAFTFTLGYLAFHQSSTTPCISSNSVSSINCIVDGGRRRISCLRDEHDIYLPFERFIRRQFDVSGQVLVGRLLIYRMACNAALV